MVLDNDRNHPKDEFKQLIVHLLHISIYKLIKAKCEILSRKNKSKGVRFWLL